MPRLKCWKKSGVLPGISGINGNYIWMNEKNHEKILEVQKVVGGGTSIALHSGDGHVELLPESGIGFKHRKTALKFAQKYMEEHDSC